MGSIESVTGAISDKSLGFTLVHEHIVAVSAGILNSWPELGGGRKEIIKNGVASLIEAKSHGVSTIVDATPVDLGRDISLLKEVSEKSNVTIIASTGFWLDASVTFKSRTISQLFDFMKREITEGIDGTDIKAGVIKLASEGILSPFEEKVFASVALIEEFIRTPIITHTSAAARSGNYQAKFLEEHGVNPEVVAIGHSDDSKEPDYLLTLLKAGYFIAMDRLPNGALAEYGGQSVADRVNMIVKLIEAGYEDKLLVSHDDPIWAGLLTDEDQARHLLSNPDQISFISKIFLPMLKEKGISSEIIEKLTISNPRKWLTGR